MSESYPRQLLDYQVLFAFDLEKGVFFSLVGIGRGPNQGGKEQSLVSEVGDV